MGLFDSKVYRLNPEVVLLAARLVGRSGILQEGENCALLRNVHTHPVCSRWIPGSVQRDKDQTSAASRWAPAHSSSVFSLINKHSQQLLGWEGRRAWCLSSSVGEAAPFRPFLTVWMPTLDIIADTWYLGKKGKVPQGCLGPACRLLRQTGILPWLLSSEMIFQWRFLKTVLLGN